MPAPTLKNVTTPEGVFPVNPEAVAYVCFFSSGPDWSKVVLLGGAGYLLVQGTVAEVITALGLSVSG